MMTGVQIEEHILGHFTQCERNIGGGLIKFQEHLDRNGETADGQAVRTASNFHIFFVLSNHTSEY